MGHGHRQVRPAAPILERIEQIRMFRDKSPIRVAGNLDARVAVLFQLLKAFEQCGLNSPGIS